MVKGTEIVAGVFSFIKGASEAVEKAIRDAHAKGYQEGYEAAIRNIVMAATNAAPTAVPAAAEAESASGAGRERVHFHDVPRHRAPWGLVPKAVNRALDGAGDHGVEIPMVIASANELGHLVAESSVRSMLIDMTNRGELERRSNGRWYRKAQSPPPEDTAARPTEGDRAAGDSNNEGEQRWTRPDESPQPPRVTDLRPGLPEGRAMREEPITPPRMVGT
jgi:hypothetical protein